MITAKNEQITARVSEQIKIRKLLNPRSLEHSRNKLSNWHGDFERVLNAISELNMNLSIFNNHAKQHIA